ncbi:MAG: hypothetical protein IPL18_15050 [Sphingomonadales bacterium]|nr:hypothetical protein [Sphingomonadales bacterium]
MSDTLEQLVRGFSRWAAKVIEPGFYAGLNPRPEISEVMEIFERTV